MYYVLKEGVKVVVVGNCELFHVEQLSIEYIYNEYVAVHKESNCILNYLSKYGIHY